ncbi:hypothetical protein KKH18_06900 [bacterium]|nr:hypothetical protein [bacterium]
MRTARNDLEALRARIIATLRRSATPLRPREVAQALGIATAPGYSDAVTRIGQQLDRLWKHGHIQCTTLLKKQRKYSANPDSYYEQNPLTDLRAARADRLDRDCLYPAPAAAQSEPGPAASRGTYAASGSAARRNPDRIPGRRRW